MERMSVSSNNLRALPEELGDCSSLQELYMNNNAKFKSLPSSMGHLKMMKELSARSCPALKALPSTAKSWSSLRQLDLRAGKKKETCKIPTDLADALKLQECVIRGGNIKKAKGKKGKKK
eukprot:scaffold2309_cov248-Pinguiococcus_pyrenoidosus.AAC.5